jgi:hypothetical protein
MCWAIAVDVVSLERAESASHACLEQRVHLTPRLRFPAVVASSLVSAVEAELALLEDSARHNHD